MKKLSLVDDENISNIILNEITNINKEINDIKLQLSNETVKINEVNKATLDTEIYIKILENFNEKIDGITDPIEKRNLLKSALESVEWNGESGEFRINLIGSKKK